MACIGTFSSTSLGYLIDLSANYSVTIVGLSCPMSNHLQIKSAIRLILASRSHNALLKDSFPIVHGIEKLPRLFNLGKNLFWRIALHFSNSAIVSDSSNFHFFKSVSFKNLAYIGIFVIASKNGTLKWVCLNILRNLSNCWPSFALRYLCGNGKTVWHLVCIDAFSSCFALMTSTIFDQWCYFMCL